MKHLISLKDWTEEEIKETVYQAITIKRNQKAWQDSLKGKTLIMLFEKTSTRTRLSFETTMTQLGGHAIFLDKRTTQFSLTDFNDEIKAVMRLGDILMFRAKKVEDVLKAASHNLVPVIDACSEKYHPTQALSDIMTMAEKSEGIKNIQKVVWLGIENNVSNTLMLACAKLGITFVIVAPEADKESIDWELNQLAEKTGKVVRTLNLREALANADYVHTDTWMNMEFFENGAVKPEFREEYERRKRLFLPYQLNAGLVNLYCPKAKIMHCMPCHVGYEISRDAIDHPNSIIFDQAENRLHAQKAIILKLLGVI
ncbi:MAG TPA: ornithine carbamoyltransferase [Candidatus Nanoarchaeia archaeon]|nr:ornithine carbamoyltransferase [Candidatus Nanoarchaeia archaeon]